MLSVVICQALVLVLPLGNIVLSVVICQVLVLPLGNSVFSSHMSSSSLGLTFKVA